MADWYASFGSDSRYRLHCQALEESVDVANNRSLIRYRLWVEKTYSGGGYYTGSGNATAGGNVAVSNWSPYDFTSYTSKLLVDTTFWAVHNPDGSGPVTITAYATDPNNFGSASIGSQSLALTKITVAPNAPSGLTCTYVSDTSATLAWTNSSASNGAATQNKIYASVNGGAFGEVVTIAAASSASVTTAANRKTVFMVSALNSAGETTSGTVTLLTTPAAPTGVAAAKDGSGNIVVTLTPQVAFAEHEHVVRHGTTTDGGVTVTWDGSPVGVLPSGTASFTHTAPSPSAQHVYAVYARNTDTAARQSSQVQSNTVVLLAAPNKPTLPPMGANVDKAKAFDFGWTYNSADTTAQTAYEVGYSTNGGTTWSSTGKIASGTPSKQFAANAYTAGQQLTLRVRTWGQATTGGSEGTGASPWSDVVAVTFKTRPVATITTPANSSVYGKAALDVALGFSQAEGATFVTAAISLYDGATLLETVNSTTLASTVLATRVANGGAYTLKVTLTDSNGLPSDEKTSAFTVTYTAPVPAVVTATYLPDSGIGQVGLAIAAPGVGQAAAVSVTITRTIAGSSEPVVTAYPVSASMTILDMTPTIHGSNVYKVTTTSADGATSVVQKTMTTAEEEWAFMSKGAGFEQIVRFGGELKPQATPSVDSALLKASGRPRPIGLYGKTGDLVVSGTGDVVIGLGSSAEELEAFLLVAGKGCYRDPTGRRMFGRITGQVSRDTYSLGSISYTVTETS